MSGHCLVEIDLTSGLRLLVNSCSYPVHSLDAFVLFPSFFCQGYSMFGLALESLALSTNERDFCETVQLS